MKKLVCGLSFAIAFSCVPAWAQEPGPPTRGLQRVGVEETIVAARELYTSAAYEDALDMLGKMRSAGPEIASTDGEVLKAFCLLALRRDDEARSVIEGVITERPTYVPGEDDASPRIRTAFQDVRKKLLPSVARQLYASAKDDYEKKNAVSAAAKFSELLKVLSDPDLAHDQTLADLRLLAEGFREISTAAANVATSADTQPLRSGPNGSKAANAPVPVLDGNVARPAAPAPVQLPVTPPVALNQQMPAWRGDVMNARTEFTGAVDLVIDERGHVESVSLRKSVHPLYDPLLLEAAKSWTYKPAMRGDQPIKFQKTLVVKLNSH